MNEWHEEAIGKWIKIIVRRQLPLHGGVSGAQVNKIDAEIRFPALEHQFKPKRIRVVVKFSGKEDFELEKANFNRLPHDLKDFFVDFAAPGHGTLVRDRYFMIMPHLENYQTLAHYVYYGSEEEERVLALEITMDELHSLHFHDYQASKTHPDKKATGKLFKPYLSEIQESFERML